MVSPVLNEQMVLATLALPMKVELAEQIRGASAYAVLCAHDRKVTREFYVDVISTSYILNEQCRRAEVLTRILMEVDSDLATVWRAKLNDRVAQALAQAEEMRVKLIELFKKLMECPVDDSIIN